MIAENSPKIFLLALSMVANIARTQGVGARNPPITDVSASDLMLELWCRHYTLALSQTSWFPRTPNRRLAT